jgi:hypothetical protein
MSDDVDNFEHSVSRWWSIRGRHHSKEHVKSRRENLRAKLEKRIECVRCWNRNKWLKTYASGYTNDVNDVVLYMIHNISLVCCVPSKALALDIQLNRPYFASQDLKAIWLLGMICRMRCNNCLSTRWDPNCESFGKRQARWISRYSLNDSISTCYIVARQAH